jgi:hypothetical protein
MGGLWSSGIGVIHLLYLRLSLPRSSRIRAYIKFDVHYIIYVDCETATVVFPRAELRVELNLESK